MVNDYSNSYACSDGIDNDGDGLIDEADPQCHTDENANNPNSYNPNIQSEQGSIIIPCEVTNSCVGNDNNLSPTPQCNDGIDNDSDGLIDIADPSCHTDFNANNEASYDPTLNDESAQPATPPNKCQIIKTYPLEYTDAEKAELAVLLRKFYLIASTLKTTDDIQLTYNKINKYKALSSQIIGLTASCYQQTDNKTDYQTFCSFPINSSLCPKNSDGSLDLSEFGLNSILNGLYFGPKTIYGNPWYRNNDRGSYLKTGAGGGVYDSSRQIKAQVSVASKDIKKGDPVMRKGGFLGDFTATGLPIIENWTFKSSELQYGNALEDIKAGQTGEIKLLNWSSLDFSGLSTLYERHSKKKDLENLLHDYEILLNVW